MREELKAKNLGTVAARIASGSTLSEEATLLGVSPPGLKLALLRAGHAYQRPRRVATWQPPQALQPQALADYCAGLPVSVIAANCGTRSVAFGSWVRRCHPDAAVRRARTESAKACAVAKKQRSRRIRLHSHCKYCPSAELDPGCVVCKTCKKERCKSKGYTGKDRHEVYARLFAEQNGACAICGGDGGKHFGEHAKSLVLDHDHATGKPRGLLCSHCNAALGLLRDTPKLLTSAINYLEKHGR